MRARKTNIIISPDLNKLQRVVIDFKTTIFIAKNADPDKARKKYQEQMYNKYIKQQ